MRTDYRTYNPSLFPDLVETYPKTTTLMEKKPSRSNHKPQVRFCTGYIVSLHYNASYVPEHPLILAERLLTLDEVLTELQALGVKAKKSTIYAATSQKRWKLQSSRVPELVQAKAERHRRKNSSKLQPANLLPVEFFVERKRK